MYKYASKNTSGRAKKPHVGEYIATILTVDYDSDYYNDAAIRIEYNLMSSSGEEFPFAELFFNDMRNERTREFSKYLRENGITNIFDGYCGRKEKVLLKKVVDNRTHLNIVEREFCDMVEGAAYAAV